MTTQQITQLKFNKLTEAQYGQITPVDNEFYITTDATYAIDSEVVHKSGDETITGIKTFDGSNVITNKEFISLTHSPYGQFRAISGNYGFFIRNDGSSTYFLLTDSNDQYGTWNSLRPLSIENANGAVRINNKVVSAFVTETYANGYAWYRKYSDGWCEQGNCFSGDVNGWQNNTATLLVPYRDVYYHVSITSSWAGNGDGASYYYANNNKTTTSFTANVTNYAAAYGYATWKASGYYA